MSPRPDSVQCCLCDFASPNEQRLKDHISAIHLRIKKWKCDQCSCAYSCSGSLKNHVKCNHEKNKQGQSDCNRPRQNLKDSSVKCNICRIICSNNASLYSHVRNVHSDKNFKCRECHYATTKVSYLKQHVKNQRHLLFLSQV
jgi:hypothetical protein